MNPADVEVFAMNAINLDDPAIELAKNLQELDERQKEDIQKKYDAGEFEDYSKKHNCNGKTNKKSSSKAEQESLKEVFSQKYVGHDYLADAVMIGFKPYFAISSKPDDT